MHELWDQPTTLYGYSGELLAWHRDALGSPLITGTLAEMTRYVMEQPHSERWRYGLSTERQFYSGEDAVVGLVRRSDYPG